MLLHKIDTVHHRDQMVGKWSSVIASSIARFLNRGRFSLFPQLKFLPSSAIVNSRTLIHSGTLSCCRSCAISSFSTFACYNYSGGSGGGRGSLAMQGGRRRPRGRGGGAGGSGTSDRIDALGRLLTRILRHMATELNLDMRSDGYVKVQELLKLNLKTRANIPLCAHSVDEVREAVRIDNKQRLGLLEENEELLIRANQGHSVEVVETESLLKPILSADEIPVCVHGTYRKNLESILTHGLKQMNRLHVHFTSGLPSDGEVISGMRRDVNLLIFLDVKKALDEGLKFYMSENKVILTEGFDGVVPAKYFEKIETWPDRNPVPFEI